MKIYKDGGFTEVCADKISYGFFGRTGGVSEGVFASLNCGPGSNDDINAVMENRKRVAANINAAQDEISSLWQCHSAECVFIDKHVAQGDDRPKADALVTDVPGLGIGILTADCGPVLFTAQKADGSPVIGAAHAGWGGALKGVLEDTIAKMVQAGAVPDSFHACVGPCIMQGSYEVKEDFMRPFAIKHEEAEHFFKAGRKEGHLMFDLPGYIAMRLALAGVRSVRLMGVDTYKEEETCFSYRRATHRGEADYGRQMSAIVINR